MPSLKIFKHGELKQTLSLYEDQEYIAGRSTKCSIIIDEAAGVSRQHFKISFENGKWQVDVLSKFAGLSFFGAQVSEILLEDGNSFSIHPYEFIFVDEKSVELSDNEISSDEAGDEVPSQMNAPSLVVDNQPSNAMTINNSQPEGGGFDETTFVGDSSEIPYLKISKSGSNEETLFRLEGDLWVAGRDPSTDIPLELDNASRKHFEIYRSEEGFFIKDLSSNGTKLNGELLQQNASIPIFSGDNITVLSLEIFFEIRDSEFENKVNALAPSMLNPPQPYVGGDEGWNHLGQPGFNPEGPGVIMQPEGQQREGPSKKFKLSKVSWSTILILILGLWFGLPSNKETKSKKETRVPANIHESFSNLKEEQRILIKETYGLAKNLYLKKKYELALAEFQRIHEIIPFYEKSRKLEEDCLQFINTQKTLEHIAEQKKAAEELEKKVQRIIENCKERMTSRTTREQLDACLSEAIDLHPEHPEIVHMHNIIEERENEKQRKKQERASYQARVKKGTYLYQKAVNLETSGKSLDAIKAYKTFIRSNYPDPKKLKPKASRSIASIEGNIQERVKKSLAQAKKHFAETKYAAAMKSLQKGLRVSPRNQLIRSTIRDYKKIISKQMKPLYEDAILEESIGNVEVAKDNWNKIKELSFPGETYYKKAKIKLKKYGL